MHGAYKSDMAMHRCDVLLCVGARFDDRITGRVDAFSPGSKKIHIDIDPSSINKNIHVDVPIIGDAGNVLGDLLQVFKAEAKKPDIKSWWQEIAAWRARIRSPTRNNESSCRNTPSRSCSRRPAATTPTSRPKSVSTRCGRRSSSGSRSRHRWMTSDGLGTMGYGLPAALGI